jgi:hypothetical protein
MACEPIREGIKESSKANSIRLKWSCHEKSKEGENKKFYDAI